MGEERLLLELKDINKSFFGIQVLHGVDLQLRAGEIHCLVGENGAGKSTIVKTICGFYKDYTGDVIVDGELVQMHSTLLSRAKGIFSVQQHRDLVPTMNAVENMFLGNYKLKKSGGIDFKTMKEETEKYLSTFGISINLDIPVSELKVSEQEIIAICKATMSDGKIFLIDEASAPLDNYERTILYGLLRQLANEGKGIIYISHHLEEIFQIGDRVTVLRNGANVWTKNTKDTDRESLIAAMTGDKELYSRQFEEAKSHEGEQPIFEFENVNNKILRDNNFKIYPGEVVGFVGLEGSGKQDIADLMFGLTRPTSGSIKYKGKEVSFSHPIDAMRKDIALIPTERKVQGLVCCRDVSDNIMLAQMNKRRSSIVSSKWANDMATQSVQDLSIKVSSNHQIVEFLSGGNQQKVLIAKWMHTNFDVLLCVEPTEGVDVGARADIYALLRKMVEEGKTIVIFSSDIDELQTLCDRIYTMTQGKIYKEYLVKDADKAQIISDILTTETEGGEPA